MAQLQPHARELAECLSTINSQRFLAKGVDYSSIHSKPAQGQAQVLNTPPIKQNELGKRKSPIKIRAAKNSAQVSEVKHSRIDLTARSASTKGVASQQRQVSQSV